MRAKCGPHTCRVDQILNREWHSVQRSRSSPAIANSSAPASAGYFVGDSNERVASVLHDLGATKNSVRQSGRISLARISRAASNAVMNPRSSSDMPFPLKWTVNISPFSSAQYPDSTLWTWRLSLDPQGAVLVSEMGRYHLRSCTTRSPHDWTIDDARALFEFPSTISYSSDRLSIASSSVNKVQISNLSL